MSRTLAILAITASVLATFMTCLVAGPSTPLVALLFLAGCGIYLLVALHGWDKAYGAGILVLALLVPLLAYAPIEGEDRTYLATPPAFLQQPFTAASVLAIPILGLCLRWRDFDPAWTSYAFGALAALALLLVLTADADLVGVPVGSMILRAIPVFLTMGIGVMLLRRPTMPPASPAKMPPGSRPSQRP